MWKTVVKVIAKIIDTADERRMKSSKRDFEDEKKPQKFKNIQSWLNLAELSSRTEMTVKHVNPCTVNYDILWKNKVQTANNNV